MPGKFLALRYLISVNEFKHFKIDLLESIDKLSTKLKVIEIETVLYFMGSLPIGRT